MELKLWGNRTLHWLNFVEGEVKTKIILHLEEAPLDLRGLIIKVAICHGGMSTRENTDYD